MGHRSRFQFTLIVALVVAASTSAIAQPTPPQPGLTKVSHGNSLTGNGTTTVQLDVRVAPNGGIDAGIGGLGVKLAPCPTGQVWQSNGTTWVCASILGGAIVESGIIRPAAITGTIDDWTPTGLAGASAIIVGTSGAATLDGITGGTEGRILNLCNTGTFELALANDTGPTPANRFLLAGATTWRLGSTGNSCATFLYDGTAARWKMISKTGTSFPSLSINTSGVASTITTYHGANSDGANIWIGGGGLNSVGDVVSTFFGSANTSIGAGTLAADTTGYENSAGGKLTLVENTSGFNNSGWGAFVLRHNTIGSYETANGALSLLAHVSGDGNTADGAGALQVDTTGTGNTAGGWFALSDLNITANDGSGNNTAYGANTGRGIVSGINNTILGANVVGLAAGLSGQIIIADGAGNRRIQVDSSAHTTLAGNVQIMATGATWTSGTGVPAISCAKGDHFSRTDGGAGSTDYDCTATNTWTALSSTVGTVTSVGATSPITSTGGATPTIAIADTAVTPASYTYASFTVDQKGRLTAASSGTAPVVSVVAGTGISVSGTTTATVTANLAGGTCSAGQHANTLSATGTLGCSADTDPGISGTIGRSARFNSTTTINNGAFTDDGTNATIGGTFGVTGAATHSSTSHFVGAVTDDSTLTTTQAAIGGTSLAGATLNVTLANASSTVGDVSAWSNQWATFGTATSTGPALGISFNSTTGAIISALAPLSTFYLMTFNALQYRWLINDNPSMALDTSGNFSMNTNKFTIADSTGNTAIAGTLKVTGVATIGPGADSPGASGTAAIVENAGSTCSEVRDATNDVEAEHCASSSGGFGGTFTNHSYFLQTNATNAIKIDTSQNVFALKTLTVGPGSDAATVASAAAIVENNGTTSLAVRDATNDVEVAITASNLTPVIGTSTNHALNISTNGTAAISIDTSQNSTFIGHIIGGSTGVSVAAGGGCGSSPSVAGNDNFGKITVGGSTSTCELTFAHAYAGHEPACHATSTSANSNISISAAGAASVTFSQASPSMSGTTFYYSCGGY